jgi:hypothetical protein
MVNTQYQYSHSDFPPVEPVVAALPAAPPRVPPVIKVASADQIRHKLITRQSRKRHPSIGGPSALIHACGISCAAMSHLFQAAGAPTS